MRTPLVLVLSAVVVLTACSKKEPEAEPVRAVRTLTVTSDAAGGRLEYAAEVRARTESRLGFRVGGKIVRRQVDLGESVKAGQVLAQLDPKDLKLGQDAARAGLQAAQANYDQIAGDFKRFKELRDQGFISSADLERRETAMKSAQAQFDQARVQSSVQGNQTGYSSLVADASGVITGVEAEPGMVVSAGTPVLRLAHDGPRDIVFSVPENKVAVIKALAALPGRFQVRFWGANDQSIPVTIREIGAAADPATRTFLVKADLGSSKQAASVQLGSTATLIAEVPGVGGVTKLPLSALKEDQGKTIVWVVDKASMTVKPQQVQIAGADGNEAVLKGGLELGQVVVTAGVHVLSPGQKVRMYVDPGMGAAALSSEPVAIKPVAVK
jgi:multidrug efflux system membrane fusion protein